MQDEIPQARVFMSGLPVMADSKAMIKAIQGILTSHGLSHTVKAVQTVQNRKGQDVERFIVDINGSPSDAASLVEAKSLSFRAKGSQKALKTMKYTQMSKPTTENRLKDSIGAHSDLVISFWEFPCGQCSPPEAAIADLEKLMEKGQTAHRGDRDELLVATEEAIRYAYGRCDGGNVSTLFDDSPEWLSGMVAQFASRLHTSFNCVHIVKYSSINKRFSGVPTHVDALKETAHFGADPFSKERSSYILNVRIGAERTLRFSELHEDVIMQHGEWIAWPASSFIPHQVLDSPVGLADDPLGSVSFVLSFRALLPREDSPHGEEDDKFSDIFKQGPQGADVEKVEKESGIEKDCDSSDAASDTKSKNESASPADGKKKKRRKKKSATPKGAAKNANGEILEFDEGGGRDSGHQEMGVDAGAIDGGPRGVSYAPNDFIPAA